MQPYQNRFLLNKVNLHVKIYFGRLFYSSKINVFKGKKNLGILVKGYSLSLWPAYENCRKNDVFKFYISSKQTQTFTQAHIVLASVQTWKVSVIGKDIFGKFCSSLRCVVQNW